MKATVIPEEYVDDFYDRIALKHTNGKFKLSFARDDPSIFATYMLGMQGDSLVRPYQDYFFKAINEHPRVAVVKARQLGMSTAVAIYTLWAAIFNKFPSGVAKNTKIGIISRGDDAAKKLLNQYIYSLVNQLNINMRKINDKFDVSQLVELKNKEMIVFSKNLYGLTVNGSYIKSLPPTDKVRGLDLDLVIVDEAAFLNNPDPNNFIKTAVLPTVAATGGRVVMLSTPNGVGNFFYDIIDPFEKREEHSYYRLVYHYTINNDEKYLKMVEEQKKIMSPSEFAQEYECDFVMSGSNFFDFNAIEKAIDDRVKDQYRKGSPVVLGVDLGWQNSLSVVVVVYKDPADGIIKLIDWKRFEPHTTGDTVKKYIDYLSEIYEIGTVVIDNCIQAKDFINEMSKDGYYVKEFDFHKEKVPSYVRFKQLMNLGVLKFPNYDVLIKEMKELIKEETSIGVPSIHKPKNGSDDVIDAFVMAVSALSDDEEGDLEVDFIE